jgi:hypothetical protein
MSREIPCPPVVQRSGMHGPRNGRIFSAAHRPPGAKAKPCRSPVRSNRAGLAGRTTSDPSAARHQRHTSNLERLNKKIGTMNLTSPIKKQSALRAHTSQGFGSILDRAQEKQRIAPFQRKPAHIKAMEDCKKPALRPTQPNARATASVSTQAAAETVARAKRSCGEVAACLTKLAERVGFNLLDKIVASRGDSALAGMRHTFDELNQLAASFAQLLVNPGVIPHIRTGEGSKSNCIQIKSVVVSLRAISDKFMQHSYDIDTASRVLRLVEQGIVEQLLSWVGECESSYEVLLPLKEERRILAKAAQLPSSATEQVRVNHVPVIRACHGSQTLRSRKQFFVQPRQGIVGELASADGQGVSPVVANAGAQRFRHPSPPGEHLFAEAPFTYSSVPRACKSLAERRERLQRHRPPMLIIPS